jgi:hypothetical protein
MCIYIAKRGKKRKAPVAATVTKANETTELDTQESTTATVQKDEPTKQETTEEKGLKKVKKQVPEGYNTGMYTELEEKNFMEALVLFGRNWSKVCLVIIQKKKRERLNLHFRSKLILELETRIQFEAMLRNTLSKCFEIKYLYQTK